MHHHTWPLDRDCFGNGRDLLPNSRGDLNCLFDPYSNWCLKEKLFIRNICAVGTDLLGAFRFHHFHQSLLESSFRPQCHKALFFALLLGATYGDWLGAR